MLSQYEEARGTRGDAGGGGRCRWGIVLVLVAWLLGLGPLRRSSGKNERGNYLK